MNGRAWNVAPPTVAPGTNIKGDAAGAAWTYLLDSLKAERILCIGEPSPASRRTLQRVFTSVQIADPADPDGWPDGPFDVIAVGHACPVGTEASARLAERLADGGRVWVEAATSTVAVDAARRAPLHTVATFVVTPSRGELETAAPADDERVRRWFREHGITARRATRPLGRLVGLLRRQETERLGMFLSTRAVTHGPVQDMPEYVRMAGAAAGVDLSRHAFGLSARGRYASRKVILYAFEPGARSPRTIVKMTRDPSHNARLLNEERALRHVARHRLVDEGSAPRVLFSGDHGGLRILGESAIEGTILSTTRSRGAIAAAYDWLIDLGLRSAASGAASRDSLVETIEWIVARVEATYDPAADELNLLQRAARRIAERADDLPTVFLHGDAAAWNAMARPDGGIAFLDWEAAETGAPPLWDVFHFARSLAVSGWRRRALARRPDRLLEAMAADRDYQRAVTTYCSRLGLDPALTPAMQTVCWAHRALREVPRLPAAKLADGHYYALMRAAAQQTNRGS